MTSLTLIINGRDFSSRISTYRVSYEVTYKKVTTTLSGKEIVTRKRMRPIITFTLLPYTDATAKDDYDVLKSPTLTVKFTDPDAAVVNGDNTLTKTMRVTGNLEHTFGLDSINGNRYYKGRAITLRSNEVV